MKSEADLFREVLGTQDRGAPYGGRHHKSWRALSLTLTLSSEGSPRTRDPRSFLRVIYRGLQGHLNPNVDIRIRHCLGNISGWGIIRDLGT